MKIITKNQTIERKNNEACVVTEFPLDDNLIDFAVIKITDRYPDAGYAINQKCKEIVYIQDGNGKVVVNNKEYLLHAGDLVLIEAGEKFYWEGEMNLFISCRPAFTIEQHKIVE